MPRIIRCRGARGQLQRVAAFLPLALLALLTACTTPHGPGLEPAEPARPQPKAPAPAGSPPPVARPLPQPEPPVVTLPPVEAPRPDAAPPSGPPSPPVATPPPGAGSLVAAQWQALPGWSTDDLGEAWPAFIASCIALKTRPEWQKPCWAASQVRQHDAATLRRFFQDHFRPYRVLNADRSTSGMVTGYYEPLLHGSRSRSERYRYPLYGVPDDLLVVELDALFPELKGQRVRGRVDGRRVVPYFTRGQIDGGEAAVAGHELLWVEDPVELFFLHVQGSGRIQLPDGGIVRVGYADHNGHPYRSIGRALVDRGELPLSKASMQGIKAWARDNPEKLPALLAENPGFVFFRELTGDASGPLGSLNVPLTPRRSIAVDPASVPLGAPVYLATTWPNTTTPLNRLMMAQDTGSAIKGGVRADFFWGFGDDAGKLAGRMKQAGSMWVLLPKDYRVAGE
jgi:membrane-bound lytic murein transglycosylase A